MKAIEIDEIARKLSKNIRMGTNTEENKGLWLMLEPLCIKSIDGAGIRYTIIAKKGEEEFHFYENEINL